MFKGSFDKANRTSMAGARGTGLDGGLRLLAMVRELQPGILVNDRLQKYCSHYPEFVATSEDPKILGVMFDLEQMIGSHDVGVEPRIEVRHPERDRPHDPSHEGEGEVQDHQERVPK